MPDPYASAGLTNDQRNAYAASGELYNGKPVLTVDEAAAQIDRGVFHFQDEPAGPITVTYGFRADAGPPESQVTGFERFTADQITAAQLSFESMSDAANISFTRVGTGTSGDAAYTDNAQILLAGADNINNGSDSGITFHPTATTSAVYINNGLFAGQTPTAGTFEAETISHELGHSVGFSHPSDYNAGQIGGVSYGADASYAEDSRQYSIMSYFPASFSSDDPNYTYTPDALQMDDIAALQRLYGANYSTRADDTTYGFNSNTDRPWYTLTSASDHISACIWDGGGDDTLDFSGYSQAQLIDLNEGDFSNVGGDYGNISIAIGAKIENAVAGSGADLILGNTLDNRLMGGAGSDTLMGGFGHDTLFGGGGGADVLYGGDDGDVLSAGTDTLGSGSVAGDSASLFGGQGADTLIAGAGAEMLFGNEDNDTITLTATTTGATVFGGQGDDFIDDRAANAPDYLSGDIGNDTILAGAGFDTVLGGQGDDRILGGMTAGAGSMQLLFGNEGADTISYGGAGSAELFGGQDNDTLAIGTSGQGQTHELFGNLGDDTLNAMGGYNSLYGGQGNDVLSTAGGAVGHNYLSGDLGDDTLTASSGGFETLRGGAGADTITLTAHASGAGDTVVVGAGESTAVAGAGAANLDHVVGFDFSSDHVVVIGHAAGTSANVTTYTDAASNSSEASAFASAYLYAYGDGTSAHPAHAGATEYLAVSETYSAGAATYVFTADHTAIAFVGAPTGSFQASAILAG